MTHHDDVPAGIRKCMHSRRRSVLSRLLYISLKVSLKLLSINSSDIIVTYQNVFVSVSQSCLLGVLSKFSMAFIDLGLAKPVQGVLIGLSFVS